jgi:hypothetical protein
MLGERVEQYPLDKEHLTDGGVFDNLGVEKMAEVCSLNTSENTRVIVVSDASAPFDWKSSSAGFSNIIQRTVRTTDILMRRVAIFEQREQNTENMIRTINIRIGDIVSEEDLRALELRGSDKSIFRLQDQSVQKLVSRIRTDLDAFSLAEICSLVRHGYEVGLKCLLQEGLILSTFRPKDPCIFPFPSITWLTAPEAIEAANKLRKLSSVVEILGEIAASGEKLDRGLAAILGEATHSTPAERDKTAREVAQLRATLENSSNTNVRLWDAGDLVCWLVVTGVTIAVGGLLWIGIIY